MFGSEEECAEGLGEVVSQGVDLLMLNPWATQKSRLNA